MRSDLVPSPSNTSSWSNVAPSVSALGDGAALQHTKPDRQVEPGLCGAGPPGGSRRTRLTPHTCLLEPLHRFIYEPRFSEDAAARRAGAAKLVQRFSLLLTAIADGELHLTGLPVLGPQHLIHVCGVRGRARRSRHPPRRRGPRLRGAADMFRQQCAEKSSSATEPAARRSTPELRTRSPPSRNLALATGPHNATRREVEELGEGSKPCRPSSVEQDDGGSRVDAELGDQVDGHRSSRAAAKPSASSHAPRTLSVASQLNRRG